MKELKIILNQENVTKKTEIIYMPDDPNHINEEIIGVLSGALHNYIFGAISDPLEQIAALDAVSKSINMAKENHPIFKVAKTIGLIDDLNQLFDKENMEE